MTLFIQKKNVKTLLSCVYIASITVDFLFPSSLDQSFSNPLQIPYLSCYQYKSISKREWPNIHWYYNSYLNIIKTFLIITKKYIRKTILKKHKIIMEQKKNSIKMDFPPLNGNLFTNVILTALSIQYLQKRKIY